VQEQLPKLLHTVILPVIDAGHEIVHSLIEEIAVDSFVGLLQDALGSIDTSN
jgi:hypothetical protein